MNIFALDSDPVRAAVAQIDKHVVKMPLETAQMLCTVAVRYGATGVRYKATHVHHPCTKWAGESRANYAWLLEHGLALAGEYTRRYGKQHACEAVIRDAVRFADAVPQRGLQPFAMAMPDEYKGDDPIASYRRYYVGAKRGFASWRTPATPPDWWSC